MLWFEHGCYYGLGMDALVTACSWITNVIMLALQSSCQHASHMSMPPHRKPGPCGCQTAQVSAVRPTWRWNPVRSCSRIPEVPKCAFYQESLVAPTPRRVAEVPKCLFYQESLVAAIPHTKAGPSSQHVHQRSGSIYMHLMAEAMVPELHRTHLVPEHPLGSSRH